MDLSEYFVTNIHATYGEAGKAWLAQLPSHIDFLSKKWNFRFVKPMPDLSYNFVALVELNSNHAIVILKTAPLEGESNVIQEARWLKSFHRACLLYTSPSPRDR